ncbi:MAG TPA: hypothetical protein VFZ58_01770 [Candidatus Saccharimonadales bacterium]
MKEALLQSPALLRRLVSDLFAAVEAGELNRQKVIAELEKLMEGRLRPVDISRWEPFVNALFGYSKPFRELYKDGLTIPQVQHFLECSGLEASEIELLRFYFGIDADHQPSIDETTEHFELSVPQIRQTIKGALEKICEQNDLPKPRG